jgi:hypothetical protein
MGKFLTKISKNAMLPKKNAGLPKCIGRYLFRWFVKRAYVWIIMCVYLEIVYGTFDGSARNLDRILRIYEDENPENDDDVENNENGSADCVFRTSYRWRPVRTG